MHLESMEYTNSYSREVKTVVKLIWASTTVKTGKKGVELVKWLEAEAHIHVLPSEPAAVEENNITNINNPFKFIIILAEKSSDIVQRNVIINTRSAINECLDSKEKRLCVIYFNDNLNESVIIEKLTLVSHILHCYLNDDITEVKKRLNTILNSKPDDLSAKPLITLTKHTAEIGMSLAWAYFFGFLIPVLKTIRPKCHEVHTYIKANVPIEDGYELVTLSRYMLIFSHSYKNLKTLDKEDSNIIPLKNTDGSDFKIELKSDRRGKPITKTPPVFIIKSPAEKKVYVVIAEVATPQEMLRDAAESRVTDMSFRAMQEIGGHFVDSLRRIMDSPSSNQFFEPSAMLSLAVVDYDDISGNQKLSEVLIKTSKNFEHEENIIQQNVDRYLPTRSTILSNLHPKIFILHGQFNSLVQMLENHYKNSYDVFSPKQDPNITTQFLIAQLYYSTQVIIVVSKEYIQNQNHPLMHQLRTSIKLLYAHMNEKFHVVVVRQHDVKKEDLPTWESSFDVVAVKEGVPTNDILTKELIENINCKMESVPIYSEKTQCGVAFAMNYFFGFLKLLMSRWKDLLAKQNDPSIHKRYIIIIPSRCRLFDIRDMDKLIMKSDQKMEFPAQRGGQTRSYNVDLYSLTNPKTGKVLKFAGEVSMPLMCLADLFEKRIGNMSYDEFLMQKSMFRDYLSQLLLAYCGDSRDFYQIIEYVEPKTNDPADNLYHTSLSQILLDLL